MPHITYVPIYCLDVTRQSSYVAHPILCDILFRYLISFDIVVQKSFGEDLILFFLASAPEMSIMFHLNQTMTKAATEAEAKWAENEITRTRGKSPPPQRLKEVKNT